MNKFIILIILSTLTNQVYSQWSSSDDKIYYNSGNVGIGYSNPDYRLEINGNGFFNSYLDIGTKRNINSLARGLNITDNDRYTNMHLTTHNWSGSHGILFGAYRSKNTVDGNLAAHGNTKYATNNDFNQGAGGLIFYSHTGNMDFLIAPTSTGKDEDIVWGPPKMRITRNGKVTIGGTNVLGNHRLYVNGSIVATEVNVKLAEQWPDYVFDPEYTLRPLEEIKDFIKGNNHLPEIPSENDVKENGIQLGEMNALLLKKIEELTLYLIQHKEELERQNDEIKLLKKQISENIK